MTTSLLALALAVLAADDPPRKPSPYAPSLPALTREEEDRIDHVIDQFILFDTGRLRGAEARQAVRDFEKLGPEAIPCLIRGLNRAAEIEHSCPVVVIAKKLNRLLMASRDPQLLEYARDEIGTDARTRHLGILRDLRVKCMLRRNALARQAPPASRPAPKSLRAMSAAELAEAAGSERGLRLRQVLVELEQRRGKEVLDGLCTVATGYDPPTRQLARDLLDRHLARQGGEFVRTKLKDEQAEVRRSAVRVVLARHASLTGELIDLLADDDPNVRTEAHRALLRRSQGVDHGPPANASASQRDEARQRWRDWWTRVSAR